MYVRMYKGEEKLSDVMHKIQNQRAINFMSMLCWIHVKDLYVNVMLDIC